MSSQDIDYDAEFEEIESKALRGVWDHSEQDRLFHACGMDELKTNGQGTNYPHTRMSHLTALYSAMMTACDTKEPEMVRATVNIAEKYLERYPSSRKFFLPALLEQIAIKGVEDDE